MKKKAPREENESKNNFLLLFFFFFNWVHGKWKCQAKWRRKLKWNECLIKGDLLSFFYNEWSLETGENAHEPRFSFGNYARTFCISLFLVREKHALKMLFNLWLPRTLTAGNFCPLATRQKTENQEHTRNIKSNPEPLANWDSL